MNRAIKALLKHNRKSLRAINQTFHIDFNQPYQAFKIDGNTTIKQILKKVENPEDKLIIVLTHNPYDYLKESFRAATIDHDGAVEIGNGYRDSYHFMWHSGIDSYYTKGDFREHIKVSSSTTIVIAQDTVLLTHPKKPSVDYTDRYRVKNPDRTYSHELVSLTNGVVVDQFHHDTNNTDFIDKSGYIVEHFQDELKRKAKVLKAERDKAAFKATDNSAKVEELRIRIQAKKLELIELLKIADTSTAIGEVSKALESWSNGLSSIMQAFERMQKGVMEQSYASIEDFNRHYNQINQMLLANGKR